MSASDCTFLRKSMRASAIAWIKVARKTGDSDALRLARADLRIAQYWRQRELQAARATA